MPALLNICFLLSFLGAHARRVDGGCRAREEAVMKGVVLGEEMLRLHMAVWVRVL